VTLGTKQQHTYKNDDPTPNGKWNRQSVTVDPKGITIVSNQLPPAVVSGNVDGGPISFAPIEGLELRNIYLRKIQVQK
jgi:hypothetical protein